jgi:hypothetical protein
LNGREQDVEQMWGLMMSRNYLAGRYDGLALWVSVCYERYPRLYLCLAVLLMLFGYAFLLLFPCLVFEGASALFRELPNAKTTEHWIVVEVWAAILLSGLFVSRQIFHLNFPRTPGLKLSKDLAPGLYATIAKVKNYVPQLSIRNVVLTDQYELRIEQTPRLGYPFWTTNTLVVGMPMLQTLSEQQFRNEMMRRFSQYASGRFRPSHWVFRSRLLWRRYLDALCKRKRLGETPMRWFFAIYTPLFETLTLPASRMDELAADIAVLEWLNDRDYFDAVKSSAIAEIFLDTHYWRKVHQTALKNSKAVLNPFAKLEHISGHLKSKDFRGKCLQDAFSFEQNFSKPVPVLSVRMQHAGQSQLRDVPIVETTAAEACLGDARKNYVSIIDKLWYSTTFSQWKAAYEQRCVDIKKVKMLSKKSRHHVLVFNEVLLYARLAKRLRGDPLHRSFLKMFKRNVETLAPSALNFFRRKPTTT